MYQKVRLCVNARWNLTNICTVSVDPIFVYTFVFDGGRIFRVSEPQEKNSNLKFEKQVIGVVQKSFYHLPQRAKGRSILSRPDTEKLIYP